ncbi:MAG: His-Xaa-Ser system protein HxsD [Patescibacteria group bacterium]
MDQGFNFKINKQAQSIEFTINTEIYSLTAIYNAAYLFLDKAYVFLDGDPKAEIIAIFKRKEGQKEENGREGLEKIAGEFYNELLNQLLREKVSESNAKIREYVVSAALYNAVPNEVDKLLQEVEEEDWQEDPLGIAKTWEDNEKSKEGKKGEMGKWK